MKKIDIIIDFEFTGLDNTFIKDNEIIQMKAMNTVTGKYICINYGSTKPISAYGKVFHKLHAFKATRGKFSREIFLEDIADLSRGKNYQFSFYGFGISQDKIMLAKYAIKLFDDIYIDIREKLQLTKNEKRLATEGSGLEAAYYIVTGKIPEINNHNGIDELHLIKELYDKLKLLRKKKLLTIMPHGFCAGMPIKDYVIAYRRNADGYRYNNNDLLAKSLDAVIEELEADYRGDEDEDLDEDE